MQKLFFAAAILLTGYAATAQQADTLIQSIDEITISASRFKEEVKLLAPQIQTIDQTDIRLTNSGSSADLLMNAGGIFVQKSQQGGGSPVLRGFEANKVLLVVDGIRMNNLIYRGGHLQNVITLDQSVMDRVEILYGPSSTLYGSDALGGVMHFITRMPAFSNTTSIKPNANAFVRYGSSNNEKTAHVDVNLGSKRWASLSSFTISKFGNLKGGSNQNPFYNGEYGVVSNHFERINDKDTMISNSNRYNQQSSGFTQYDALQKLTYSSSENMQHTLNFQWSSSTDVPRYDRLSERTASGNARFAEWYYGPQNRLLAAYHLDSRKPCQWVDALKSVVSYQMIEESRHTRRFGNDNLQHRTEKVNVFGLNTDAMKQKGDHTFRAGIDAQYSTVHSTAFQENISTGMESPLSTRYPDGLNYMMQAALYVSHQWNLSDHFILSEGLRGGISQLHSEFKDTTFYQFPFSKVDQQNGVYSGNISLVHRPSDNLKLSAMFSTGYRVPNVDDLSKIFETVSGSVIVPNENLKPEQTYNYDAGITAYFGKRSWWETHVWYTDYTNIIITDRYQYNGSDSIVYDGVNSVVLANQNKKKAWLFGLSSVVRYSFTNNLMLNYALNYTYGRIKTDSSDAPLDHIAPLQMRLGLQYQYRSFSTLFYANFNGWKRLKDYYLNGEDNEQYATSQGMPAWFTLNLHAGYDINRYVSVDAGVDNLLDTQYRVFASGINAPGRHVSIALRLHY